ncbi:glycosyltransferase family 39 protein [Maribellus maritimus]|uniref:glycosyltransferase family 39 protein n=1 Tax=Maribellus maritimus TaxID=2870838 RepID=UPI001EEB679C|nr:glycosyltransferase family 39 protein [Maribellus maritimus]MCG6186200.1 glycosyltransferase family 39 protein [Maribellus maritimus]
MKKQHLILLGFILLKFILQYFAINPVYELHRDEFLHIDLGKHLAWGYTSVPPLTGLLSKIILLFGESVFWVKFFPALFGAMVIWVVWKIVEELDGGIFAQILATVSILFSVFIRINTLYQPNSLDFLCWTLLFYTLLKYFKTDKNRWLYFSALVFAIGFLNKYNIGFLLLGLLPALLLTKQRTIFKNKHLWFAALLALLLISPNIIWQFQNGMPVVKHMRTLAETQLVNVNRSDFLLEQLYFFPGALLVILLAFVSFFTLKKHRIYRVFFYSFIFTLLIFTYLKAKGYYAIGLYPVFIGFGAVYFEYLMSVGWKRYLRIPVVLLPALIFIPVAPLMLPVYSPKQIMEKKELFDKYGTTRWEDGKIHNLPQDYADMLGWKELAHIVDSTFMLIEDKDRTIIHCDNYGQAGAINYYSSQKNTEALSLSADYINWYPFDEFEIVNVILVQIKTDDDPERKREREFFEEVKLIGKISTKNAREEGTSVYLLRGATVSINDILREEIRSRR